MSRRISCQRKSACTENRKRNCFGNGSNCLIQDSKVARQGRFDPLFFCQRVNGEERFSLLFSIQSDGAPGGTRTPGPLVRRYTVQNSKCRCWCRLQRNASFISLLSWTEDGLKWLIARLRTLRSSEKRVDATVRKSITGRIFGRTA